MRCAQCWEYILDDDAEICVTDDCTVFMLHKEWCFTRYFCEHDVNVRIFDKDEVENV